jgi:hypothetical protein
MDCLDLRKYYEATLEGVKHADSHVDSEVDFQVDSGPW